MIISFSGIDSSGKSTQISLLEEAFQTRGIRYCRKWSKARGTPGIVFLKSLVRRDNNMQDQEKKEYRAGFFQNKRKKKFLLIASLLDLILYWGIYLRCLELFYQYIICDRYLWDTVVELNSDFKGITYEKWLLWRIVVAVAPKPQHAFVFVIPAELSITRDIAKHANGIEDIESKRTKIQSYADLIAQHKLDHVMDGTSEIQSIHEAILEILDLNGER